MNVRHTRPQKNAKHGDETIGLLNRKIIYIMIKSHTISLQQKVSLYFKWFDWILSEFTSCSEQGPMKTQWNDFIGSWVNSLVVVNKDQWKGNEMISLDFEWIH